MRLELNAILNRKFMYSDSDSNTDDDDDYPEYNGDTLKGAKRVDSDDDNYLDNNTN
jgi:hypothetical protein